jgi:3-oxoacyl-[acyl-carrier protein] reductase
VWDDAFKNNRQRYDSTLARIPFGRMGKPEEVASLAVFLGASPASWITGQIISVDGGQLLAPS